MFDPLTALTGRTGPASTGPHPHPITDLAGDGSGFLAAFLLPAPAAPVPAADGAAPAAAGVAPPPGEPRPDAPVAGPEQVGQPTASIAGLRDLTHDTQPIASGPAGKEAKGPVAPLFRRAPPPAEDGLAPMAAIAPPPLAPAPGGLLPVEPPPTPPMQAFGARAHPDALSAAKTIRSPAVSGQPDGPLPGQNPPSATPSNATTQPERAPARFRLSPPVPVATSPDLSVPIHGPARATQLLGATAPPGAAAWSAPPPLATGLTSVAIPVLPPAGPSGDPLRPSPATGRADAQPIAPMPSAFALPSATMHATTVSQGSALPGPDAALPDQPPGRTDGAPMPAPVPANGPAPAPPSQAPVVGSSGAAAPALPVTPPVPVDQQPATRAVPPPPTARTAPGPETTGGDLARPGPQPIDPAPRQGPDIALAADPAPLPRTSDAAGQSPTAPHRTPEAAIVRQIVTAVRADTSREPGAPIDIALDPPELGRVRLSLAEVNGALSLTIAVERPETADLMRRHIALLAQEFARAGIDAPSVNISQGGAEGRGQGAPTPARPDLPQTAPADPLLPQSTARAPTPSKDGLDLRL